MAKQIILTQNDYGIELETQFINDKKQPLDITDYDIRVKIIYNNETIYTILAGHKDNTNGIAYIVLEKKYLLNAGLYTTVWSVVDEDKHITAQENLYYFVKDVEGSKDDTPTTDLPIDADSILNKFKEVDDNLFELNEQKNIVNESMDITNKAIQNINEHLDNNTQDIKLIASISNDENTDDFIEQVNSENGYSLLTKNKTVDKVIQATTPNTNIKNTNKKLTRIFVDGNTFNLNADNIKVSELNIENNSSNATSIELNVMKNDIIIDKNNIKNKKDSCGHGIYSDVQNTENLIIVENNINVGSYGVLVNEKGLNSKNAVVSNNIIDSYRGDGIAFNNPVPVNTDVEQAFHNAVIVGNITKTDNGSTTNYSGYGVSVADTHNVAVVGNVVPYARTEGIHFEGTIDNCLAVGNVIDKCKNDGTSILNIKRQFDNNTTNGEPVIINSNQYKSLNNKQSGNGVYIINDENGLIDNNIITNNIFKGFENGVFADGQELTFVDNNIFKGSLNGLKVGVNSRIVGENICVNSTNLITSTLGNGTIAPKMYSNIKPQKVIDCSGSGGRRVGCKGFYFKNLTNFSLNSNVDNTIKIIETPIYAQGKLYFELWGNNSLDTLLFIADIVCNNGVYALSNVLNIGRNAFSNKTVSLTVLDGEMSIKIASCGGLTDTKFKYIVEFDGYYLK